MIGQGTHLETGFKIMTLVNGSPEGRLYMMDSKKEHLNLAKDEGNALDSYYIAYCMGIEEDCYLYDHISDNWQDFFMSNRAAAPLAGCPG